MIHKEKMSCLFLYIHTIFGYFKCLKLNKRSKNLSISIKSKCFRGKTSFSYCGVDLLTNRKQHNESKRKQEVFHAFTLKMLTKLQLWCVLSKSRNTSPIIKVKGATRYIHIKLGRDTASVSTEFVANNRLLQTGRGCCACDKTNRKIGH